MSQYTVRVEMHGAEDEQIYEDLHEAMGNEGFIKTIKGTNATFHLPSAEYIYKGSEDRKSVWSKANTAATKIQKKYGLSKSPSILVTESLGVTFSGLDKVED